MRIAFYVGKFPVISQTFILNQIIGMIDRGHEVDVYAFKPVEDQKIHPDVSNYDLIKRVRYIPTIPQNFVLRMLKAGSLALCGEGWRKPMILCRALNIRRYHYYAASLRLLYAAAPPLGRPSYDVIHAQFGPLGLRALALRQIGALRGRLVTSFRGADANRRLQVQPDFYAELFREGDLFLPVSNSLKQRLIEYGCAENKIVVHHSGIVCSKFTCSLRRRDEREESRLISIARLVEKKGIPDAIRAVSRLVASGRKVTYSVVGDGDLRPEIERLIAELGVGQEVKLLGWRTHDEVIGLLENAHILVAPSIIADNGDQEGIPNSIKEAMAMGLPVVSTIHGGIPELVENGISGFLVPERNVDALVDRLAWLHDHPEMWATIGRAGRTTIEREFDINKLNDELEELYSSVGREKCRLSEIEGEKQEDVQA